MVAKIPMILWTDGGISRIKIELCHPRMFDRLGGGYFQLS